ncbi:MAG: hypothetical protein AB1553_14865 [Nitrospirota bacterium]
MSEAEKAAVEDCILNYWDELNRAKEIAHDLANGHPEDNFYNRQTVIYYLNHNGYKQWSILKTIGPDYLSVNATLRLALLERKFQGKRIAEPNTIKGGLVPPPIRRDCAKFMTDSQWLQAIRAYHNGREILRKSDHWVFHSGASGLAQVLQERTKEEPDRFTQLLLHLPAGTAHYYPEGILVGLADSEASSETLLRAIQHAHSQPDRPFGSGISRIFQGHPLLANNDQAFEILLWYVENGNASTEGESEAKRVEQETVNVDQLTERGNALQIRGYYGDRGTAAEALGAVLWECPSKIEEGISCLARCVANEPLLSIRCSLVRPIYSVLRHDNQWAADLLRSLVIRADGPEITPLTTSDGVHALFYILHGSPSVGRELLDLLLQSSDESQQLIGIYHLFREAFYDSDLAERADTLISKDDAHRKLAADTAANHLPYAEYRYRAEAQLETFFNDPVKEIRAEAAECFRNLKTDEVNSYRQLMRTFIQSKAFEEENFSFFFLLKGSHDHVFEEVVLSSERLIELIEGDNKSGPFREMHYLEDLIRREYAAVADHPELRRRLLNVIDRMLLLGLYGTDQIIREHERG